MGRRSSACIPTTVALVVLLGSTVMAPRIASAERVPRGDVLVVATDTGGSGGLLRVDRDDGTRTLVSDFADPEQGPVVARASDVAVTPAGRVLVADAGPAGMAGAVLEVARDGSRRLVSDLRDPRAGPVGSPHALAVTDEGAILILTGAPGARRRDLLLAVDRRGRRTLLSDFTDDTQGPTLIPAGITVRADGSIVVLSHVTGGDAPLVEIARDGHRTVLSQLADGQGPGVELPTGIVESPAGTLLVLEEFGGSPFGMLIAVAADGTRVVERDLSDPRFGPTTASPADLQVEADGTLLVLDREAGTPLALGGGSSLGRGALLVVDPDGTRVVRSDFGDASQGATFAEVKSAALLPGRDACRRARLARTRVADGAPPRGARRGLLADAVSSVGGGWCRSTGGGADRLATRR